MQVKKQQVSIYEAHYAGILSYNVVAAVTYRCSGITTTSPRLLPTRSVDSLTPYGAEDDKVCSGMT